MKCDTPIDSETGMPLSGTVLEQALKDPNSPRCGRELSPDDIFCPGCGAKVKIPLEQDSVASTDSDSATGSSKKRTRMRATRANLWGAAAAFFASNIVYFIISGGDFDNSDGNLSRGAFLRILGYVNLFAYGYFIKTSVRRLHDMARSGWWMLPSIVFTLAATVTTVVSAVSGSSNVFFAFCDVCALVSNLATVAWLGFAKGTQGPNKYGPDPRAGADVPIGSDVGNAKEGEMTGRVIGNADSSIGGRGLAAEDNASSSNDMDAELMVKPRTRSISRRDLIAWSVVAVIVGGVAPFMFQDHSNKEKKRVCDMLTHNLETTRENYATLLDHNIEKAVKSVKKAKLDGMFGVEFGGRVPSDVAVIPSGDGTWLVPFEPAAPELAFSGYYKIVLPKTRVVCGIAAATEFSETEKEKCLATYETYKKNIGQSYGEMATLNRKPGSYGANGSEQVCQSIVECAAKRIITLEIVKSVGGGCMLRLCALDISMTENLFEESKQAAAELPSLDGLFGMKLGMRIEPTEKEEMLAEGYGVQLFTPDEPFLDFELYAIKFLPKSRKAYEIVAVHSCETRFAASESFESACRQMENMFKQKMTDITAYFNTTGPDEDGEQRLKAVMITFPNSLRFLLIEQVRNIDDGAFRVRITAHDKKLFDTLESEVKAMEASDVSGFATLDADGKAAKVPPGINGSEEVSRLRKAAEQGDASAQYNLGVCYANGKGVEQDKQEAVKWYRKAAEQGYAKSQCQLGFCYARGEGVAKDMNESLTWFHKAAEQGDGAACYEIAEVYRKGLVGKADMNKAAEWYGKGTELGHSGCAMSLGFRYLYGESDLTPKNHKKAMELFQKSIEIDRRPWGYYGAGLVYYYGTDGVPDYKKAIELFKEASTLGVEKADYFLGICYEKGQGVSKDPKEAVKWYRKASERGFADAEYSLGLCLLYGKGVPREPDEAANWFEKAANHGNLYACYEMGRAYERGNGRTKDIDKAAEWYQKGADGGNPACCSQLGYRYLNGDCNFVKKDVNKALALFLQSLKADPKGQWAYHGAGLAFLGRGQSPSDFQKAAEMFRKAADIGLAQSQHYLGKCYEKGQGVSKDPKEAVKWYRKAAEQGYAVSEYNLGVCYRDGWGVNKDLVKSADWFEKAANHGNVDACYEIGACYERGEGRDKNPEKAIEWYQKAAAGENETAKKALDRLRKPADDPSETLSSKSSREVVEEILSMADIVRGFDQEKKRYTEIATRGFPLKHEGVDIVKKSESYDFPDQEGDDLETKRFKRVWMAYADGLAGIASSMSMSLKSFDEDVASNKTVHSIVSNARQTLDGVVTVALAESVENDKYEVTVAVAQSEKRKRAYQDYKAGKEGGASGKYSLEEWMNAKSAAGIICPQSFVDNEGVWWRVAGVPVARDRVSGNANKDRVEKARYLAALAACRTISVDVMKNSVLNIRRYADKGGEIMPHRTFEREVKITPVCSNHDTSSFKWFEIKSTSPISGDVLLVVCAIREDPGTEPTLNRQ